MTVTTTRKRNRSKKLARRIGVYGGTFNPIHLAHLVLAEEIRERLKLDRVLFIPSGKPPHKRARVPEGRQRLEMVRLAIVGNRFFSALNLEVVRKGKSYTIETLRELHRRFPPETEFFFLIGMDAFREITTWREADHLANYVNFVIFSRPGYPLLPPRPFLPPSWKPTLVRRASSGLRLYHLEGQHNLYLLETEALPISASSIRLRAARGRSLKYLVPQEVEKYIIKHKLYRKPIKGG